LESIEHYLSADVKQSRAGWGPNSDHCYLTNAYLFDRWESNLGWPFDARTNKLACLRSNIGQRHFKSLHLFDSWELNGGHPLMWNRMNLRAGHCILIRVI
jgi:hypothetical protein